MLHRLLSVLFVAFLVLTAIGPTDAQRTIPPAPRLRLVADGLERPTHVTHPGDGGDRLLIVEKRATVRVLQGGIVLPTPFLDLRDRVLSLAPEQGLFSLAFPPGGAAAGHFYVNYTAVPNGDTVVSRFSVSTDDPNRADPATEEIVLTISQPFANHNGGQIAFGPDGYLYVATGDGGSAGDPHGHAQNSASLLGKILRIDVESPPAGQAYGVPSSNPFTDTVGFRPEIWALGLRNPWRFSFDRVTGDLYIADVGQNRREEVNFQPAGGGGENYGWSIMEGSLCYPADPCDAAGLTLPVAEYGHDQGNSITGGFVYRAPWPAAWQGLYFYGDFGSGRLWALRRDGDAWATTVVMDTSLSISTFGEDEAGRLYLADYAGAVYLLEAATDNYLPMIRRRG